MVKNGTPDAHQLSGSLQDLSLSNVGHFEWVQSDIQGPRYGGKGKSRNNCVTRRGMVKTVQVGHKLMDSNDTISATKTGADMGVILI